MPRSLMLRAAALAAATTTLCGAAAAHGVAGKRFFPATLATDDPFVADELSLPTFSTTRTPAGGDNASTTRENEIAVDFAKRITPDLGFSIGESWRNTAPKFDKPHYGFGNLETQVKYQFYKSDEHETILSAGVGFEFGGTGASQIGADRFNTVSPTVFFGKGFGDLPDSVPYLKPIAITGTVGGAIPLRSSSNKFSVNPDTGDVDVEAERHPNTLRYGIAIEYSLPYLQASVRNVGLGAPFDRLIPLVEFAFETPLDRGSGGKTTGTINPGLIWAGQFMQVGLEAVLPVNDRSTRGVGAIFQLHFFMDDLFPTTLGRPLLGGSK